MMSSIDYDRYDKIRSTMSSQPRKGDLLCGGCCQVNATSTALESDCTYPLPFSYLPSPVDGVSTYVDGGEDEIDCLGKSR